MSDRIARGEIDALIEGVMPTLALERQTGLLDPELLVWRKGQRQYVTVFFTRKDSSIQELQDLRGRTIAFERRFRAI
jgi:phosphonate transport system substrate-binding protein